MVIFLNNLYIFSTVGIRILRVNTTVKTDHSYMTCNMKKKKPVSHSGNKGPDQPVCSHSLIRALPEEGLCCLLTESMNNAKCIDKQKKP